MTHQERIHLFKSELENVYRHIEQNPKIKSYPDIVLDVWVEFLSSIYSNLYLFSPGELEKELEVLKVPFLNGKLFYKTTVVNIKLYPENQQKRISAILLICIKLLLHLGKKELALAVCKLNITRIPEHLYCRIAIENHYCIALWMSEKARKNFNWIDHYHSYQEEKIYPLKISSIKPTNFLGNDTYIAESYCGNCNNSISVSTNCENLLSTFICPKCFCKLEKDRDTAKEQCKEFLVETITHIPINQEGRVDPPFVEKVKRLAEQFKNLALIRFGKVHSSRIGHFIENTAIYIHRKKAGIIPDSIDVIGVDYHMEVSNTYLWKLWQRILPMTHIIGSQVCEALEHESEHSLYHELSWAGTMMYPFPKLMKPIQLPISIDEEQAALQKMEQMGIPMGAKYVCLHIRTHHYLNSSPDSEDSVRNADINTYKKACLHLNSLGYFVIRMGSPKMPPIDFADSMIIDYSTHHANELLDIYLSLNCFFMISTVSGIDALPALLKKKVLFTNDIYNYPDYGRYANAKILRKHIKEVSTGTYLDPFKLEKTGGQVPSPSDRDFEIIDNTEDEILDAVIEMLDIVKNGKDVNNKSVPPEYSHFSKVYLQQYL